VADWDQRLGAHVDVAHAWSGQPTDVAKISRTFESLAPPICRVWLAPLQGRARVPARRMSRRSPHRSATLQPEFRLRLRKTVDRELEVILGVSS
jgi:hypothetical protein